MIRGLVLSCAVSVLASAEAGVRWADWLDVPERYGRFDRRVTKVADYAFDRFTVEEYVQVNGPGTSQRVMMAVPKDAKGRLPAVVVPFYFPEAMLGFDPKNGSVESPLAPAKTNLTYYAAVTYMNDLARRGYITVSADAYHLTYATNGAPDSSWAKWKHAGEALVRDWPGWTGIGKLVFDTRLLIDLVAADPRVDADRIGIIGHSLGGKMAFYAGCLDSRVKVIVASDFGIGWDQTNWKDVWYWGDWLADVRAAGLDHAGLLSLANGKPFCLIAGKYDDATSGEMMRRAKGYENYPERLKLINHATGHRPPPAATGEGYGFLDVYLKNASGLPPPCDPKPVKKPVKVVRREVKVAIIGADRPKGPENVLHANAKNCFAYWKRWMDREIANKPDLVVLPEGVISYRGYDPDRKREVVQRCGDGLLKLFQSYAREHACYLSFNAYRQRPDGRFANTSFFLDREGDVIGVYDKVYPTPREIECKEFPIVPGERPVVVETDFGRVGFATCFDLNFRDLIEAYAKERPDVICFLSAYDGDFWRRAWSYTCRACLPDRLHGRSSRQGDRRGGALRVDRHLERPPRNGAADPLRPVLARGLDDDDLLWQFPDGGGRALRRRRSRADWDERLPAAVRGRRPHGDPRHAGVDVE